MIGDRTSVPHITSCCIISVCNVLAVSTVIEGISRHFRGLLC